MSNLHYILLPANSGFIALSLALAFLLNLLPIEQSINIPDFVRLVLIFWSIYEPQKIGISIAFVMGLLMDVNKATLLGENALAYTLLSYFSIVIRHRILWFSIKIQVFHILLLLLITQMVQLIIHFLISNQLPYWSSYFIESFFCALLWPLITWLLLLPQRRVINRDENRPI